MTITLRITLPLLLALALSACTTTSPEAAPLSRRVLLDSANDTTSAHAGPLAASHSTRVIRTRAEWEILWSAMHANPVTGEPSMSTAPVVDFSQEMIIAIGTGEKPNGCYRAEITDIVDIDGHRVVVAKDINSEGCGVACTRAVVHPVLIVAAPRTDQEVTFQWRAETVCP